MEFKVKINGSDVTSRVITDSFKSTSNIASRIDICTMIIEDDGIIATPTAKQEIIVSNTAETVRYFAGYISRVNLKLHGITRQYCIEAQDYTILADGIIVNEIFEDLSDGRIINDLFYEYLPEIKTNWLNFDGGSDNVIVSHDASIASMSEFTLEATIRAVSAGGGNTGRIFDKRGSAGQGYAFYVGLKNGGSVALAGLVDHATTDASRKAFSVVTVDDWHMVHMTYNEDGDKRIKIYVDGVLATVGDDTAGVGSQEDSAADLYIGNNEGDTMNFDGDICDVGVYDAALTAAEVLERVRHQSHTADLQLGLSLREGAGSTSYDWAQSLDGTITGATWAGDVGANKTIDRVTLHRASLRSVLDKLCKMSKYDWYIDYNKHLHFFPGTANDAPHGLSDNPNGSTTYPYRMRDYKFDATKLCNRVIVQGGSYWSSNTDFELPNDGQTTEMMVPYKLHAPTTDDGVLIYKNTGSDVSPTWTAQGVGVDYIDTLGGSIDVLYNYQEKLLKWNTAPSDLKRAVKITGRYDVPILVRVTSNTSYEQYGYRWYDEKIIDTTIETSAYARQRGQALLMERAFEQEYGSLTTWEDGLFAGQRIYITDSLRGLDGYYLIQSVQTKLLGNGQAEYNVKYGAYTPTLVDFLVKLKQEAAEAAEVRMGVSDSDLTLDELLDSVSETLSLADGTPSVAATGDAGYFCAPSGGQDPIICGYWKAS